MKLTINSIHSIAIWKWNLKPTTTTTITTTTIEKNGMVEDEEEEEEEEDEDEDDVCGICRVAYDGACPDCKTPGDECPLIWGECTHVFHMHCLLKWINTESSKQQCPMDRRPWVTADALSPSSNKVVAVPPPMNQSDGEQEEEEEEGGGMLVEV